MPDVPPAADAPPVPELAARLGVPAWRVRLDPPPGAATAHDLTPLAERDKDFCDLLDGTLVEHAGTLGTAQVGMRFLVELANWNADRHGWAFGGGCFHHLPRGGHACDRLRAPAAAFVFDDQRPGHLERVGWGTGAPRVCVELDAPGRTPRELELARHDYFSNGCAVCRTADCETRTVTVHTPDTGPAAGAGRTLGVAEELTTPVLPRFRAPVGRLFAVLDDLPFGLPWDHSARRRPELAGAGR